MPEFRSVVPEPGPESLQSASLGASHSEAFGSSSASEAEAEPKPVQASKSHAAEEFRNDFNFRIQKFK